jgi:hypothetical protein
VHTQDTNFLHVRKNCYFFISVVVSSGCRSKINASEMYLTWGKCLCWVQKAYNVNCWGRLCLICRQSQFPFSSRYHTTRCLLGISKQSIFHNPIPTKSRGYVGKLHVCTPKHTGYNIFKGYLKYPEKRNWSVIFTISCPVMVKVSYCGKR